MSRLLSVGCAIFAASLGLIASASASVRVPLGEGHLDIYAGGAKVATEGYDFSAGRADTLLMRAEVEARALGDTVGVVNASYVKMHPELYVDASTGRFLLYHSLGLAHGTIEDITVLPEPGGVHEYGQTMEMTALDHPTPLDSHAPFDTLHGVVVDLRVLSSFYGLLAHYNLDSGGAQTFPAYSPSSGNSVDATVTDNGVLAVRMPNGLYAARHFFVLLGRDAVNIWTDDSLRIVRLTLPVQGVEALQHNYYGTSWTGAQPEDGLRIAPIEFPTAGATLSGVLVRPAGNATVPGVVLVNGLGRRTRDGGMVGSPLVQDGAKYLAAALARRGFAVLRFDSRGVGRSTGNARTVTLEDRAADCQAAVRAMVKVKGVDKKRVAVIASDVGAFGAALASAKDMRWAAAVLIGPPGDPIDSLMFERVRATPMSQDDAGEAIEQVQRLSELLAGTDLWAAWGGDSLYLPAYRQLVSHKPDEMIARLSCPTSIVICGQDRDVPAESSRRLLAALQARHATNIDVAEFPLLDHSLMQLLPGAGLPDLTDASRTVDDDVAGQIADWLRGKMMTATGTK